MKTWKRFLSVCLATALTAGSSSAMAEPVQPVQEEFTEGQLTLEDISALNDNAEEVYMHDGRVTFVAGTCSEQTVANTEDAAAVVESMMTLIGADADMEFVPWREVTDPMGNNYYIFQQMYHDTTVCGGAVKVITDADGNMIGLSSSVESEMPDVDPETGITAEEAEQIVLQKEYEEKELRLQVLGQYTDKVVLPNLIKYDITSEDTTSRFAWVVYTNNPSANVQYSSDLPYLAHYVTMSGEYLYNMPAIAPADEAGRSGYDAGYIFEFMEPAEYTGYVDMTDGSEKEITVTVMRDRRTGMYYLGNIERRIVVADCFNFLYNDGQVVLEASPDNLEWDQVGLLSLYNYCRAWDYYNEIGWRGSDGENTPIIVLNNFCDDHYNEVDNAAYVGKVNGMQAFLASKINDFSQCLDIITHEFTHCVTGSLMTYTSYLNDFGAINEAISDIQGKNADMMAGDVEPDNWVMGANSKVKMRSMSDPHRYGQPEYTWDLYYKANAKTPSAINDHGGVHSNSSLLNYIAYLLVNDGGMTLEEARIFWFMTDCAMVPQTDYAQLAELLPWVLKTAGMEKYEETLTAGIQKTRLGVDTMPETIDDDRALITMHLPDTEAFDTGNWTMQIVSIKVEEAVMGVLKMMSVFINGDVTDLPEQLQIIIEKAKALEGQPEPESEGAKEAVAKELLEWIRGKIRDLYFSSNGSAGQDGSTLNIVARPGRSIPVLLHATLPEGSQEPDQLVYAVYIHGKWYDLHVGDTAGEPEDSNSKEIYEPILKDAFGENGENLDPENIESLDDLLDLFTIEIRGGEKLEISTNGLDQIVIPDPVPPEEKAYGVIEPGLKSRPKLDAEDDAA